MQHGPSPLHARTHVGHMNAVRARTSGVGPVELGGSMMMRGDAVVSGCASSACEMMLCAGQCMAALLLSLDRCST